MNRLKNLNTAENFSLPNMFSQLTFYFSTSKRLYIPFFLLTLHFALLSSLSAQVVYEESNNDVYSFLNRISQRGIIDFDNLIKPIPRLVIAEKLEELNSKKKSLSYLEIEELQYFRNDLGIEISLLSDTLINVSKMSLFEFDRYKRFRVFSYESKGFSIVAKPILGYEHGVVEDGTNSHRWNGLQFHGYIDDNIGFEFSFRDNNESGDNLNRAKYFTEETGVTIAKGNKDSFEYSDFTGSISYSWNWGDISIAKQQLTWGYEKSGNIVLSNKAPSFPVIRLDIKPTDWFRFNYFHGWLNSDVEDTNLAYSSFVEDHNRQIYRNKYIASHTLTLTPTQGLDISLGESIVYSEELQIAYLFPMMFFRAADHYLAYPNNDAGDNSQFFFNISSKNHLKNSHLYASLFIDEIRTGEIFNSDKQRNQIGYNFGLSITDLPINNLTFEIEYTHINPFAYIHYIPSLTYQSDSYNLGHWMGHNGDLFYTALNYRFLRGLKAKIWFQSVRKGEEGLPVQQWDTSIPQPEFLFGLNTNYTYYGLDVNYEFDHDLNIRAKYQYSSIETEYEEGKFSNDSYSTFKFALYYGL
jgi:Capsule assembly protein Wzi